VLEGFNNAVEDESFLGYDTVLIVNSEKLAASIFRVIGLPWMLMQDGPLKHLWIVTNGHGIISQKTLFPSQKMLL
jgi:hypothetical protein